MIHEWSSRVTARARRALGTTGIEERLSDLTRRVDSLQGALDERPPGTAYLGDHTALVETRWGGILLIDSRESVLGPALLLKGQWEPDVTKWFQRTLRPGQVFVDVGANIGYYSLLGSMLVKDGGQVFAVEAHPRMAELLHRNVIVNGLHNVTTFHKAAWSKHEVLEFHMRRHFAANSSAGSLGPDGLQLLDDSEDLFKVDAEPVDEMLSRVSRVDVIKIDVEGAEVQVLNGLSRTLGSNPDVKVMLEWSPGQLEMVGNAPTELIGLLRGQGFKLRLIEKNLSEVSDVQLLDTHYGNVVASRSQVSSPTASTLTFFELGQITQGVPVVLPFLFQDHLQALQQCVFLTRVAGCFRGNAYPFQLFRVRSGDHIPYLCHAFAA